MDELLLPDQLPDRETFERVWARVMPDCSAGPIALTPPQEPQEPPAPAPASAPAPAAPSPSTPSVQVLLERLMDKAAARAAAFQALSRRGGTGSRPLSAMAADCRKDFRQLSTVHFLLTGTRFQPNVVPSSLSPHTSLALRERYLDSLEWQHLCEQAAALHADPVLTDLFSTLAQEGRGHAKAIRSILEQMCPAP